MNTVTINSPEIHSVNTHGATYTLHKGDNPGIPAGEIAEYILSVVEGSSIVPDSVPEKPKKVSDAG